MSACWCCGFHPSHADSLPGFCRRQACPHQGSTCARDVLRLKLEARLSHERIAASLGISKGVVAKYVGLGSVAGLNWPTIQTLSDTALERRVVQGRLGRPSHYVLPDYGRVHQELRRKGVRAEVEVSHRGCG